MRRATVGTVATAWERFHAGDEPAGVRGEVLTSWRRSRLSGVDPEHVQPPHVGADPDTELARVGVPVLARMAELLTGERACLALADARGSVLWRWVSETVLRTTLDELSVAQGFCFDESLVGTNGLGTALETGALAVVRGSEHFVQRFHDVTCVAAPVRHPVTRRTLGAVNVTCRAQQTSPLLAVLVRKLVAEVQDALLDAATATQRAVLDAYLRAPRSGPVLALGPGVVIADAAATALDVDHAQLWEEVRGRADGDVVLLGDLPARVGVAPDAVTLTVTGAARHRPAPAPRDDWAHWVARARALLAAGPLVVHGEPGTGKTALLREAGAVDGDGAPGPLLVRHVDLLPPDALRRLSARPGVLAATAAGPDVAARLGARTLAVAPLRRRDVGELARRALHVHGAHLAFAPDALEALRRHDWPGNLRELGVVVADAAEHAHGGVVGLDALPPRLRLAAAGRRLTPLERAEAETIAAVLAECEGNRSAAARALGISRSALYAKLRAYRL